MHMRDDHVGDSRRIDVEGLRSLARTFDKSAAALASNRFTKTRVDDECPVGGPDGPDEVVERHGRLVVGIAGDEILTSGALMMRISRRVDFPKSVGHKWASL